ncbi:hypothetical protein SD81_031115 [Tolypothrix campylonemoides VB511288]|nr:hypothetical protein SD81_031115 [Tolypothrix campylonemoides VB511288]
MSNNFTTLHLQYVTSHYQQCWLNAAIDTVLATDLSFDGFGGMVCPVWGMPSNACKSSIDFVG